MKTVFAMIADLDRWPDDLGYNAEFTKIWRMWRGTPMKEADSPK